MHVSGLENINRNISFSLVSFKCFASSLFCFEIYLKKNKCILCLMKRIYITKVYPRMKITSFSFIYFHVCFTPPPPLINIYKIERTCLRKKIITKSASRKKIITYTLLPLLIFILSLQFSFPCLAF